jgi:hypothetical protein
MAARALETDYLVVGSGAAGMAFTDSLISETDAEIVMVDRRSAPGGHWNDAYPFVRLHQPSRYYGVNSTPLGGDAVELRGPEAGQYERTRGSEVRAYYARVMEKRLIASGRVRYFPNCEYVGKHRFVSRLSGATFDVKVRRKLVDANYLSPPIPALTPAPFNVGDGASAIPVHRLVDVVEKPDRYVIVGAGKTALDACVWLLRNGVDAADVAEADDVFDAPEQLDLPVADRRALPHRRSHAAVDSSHLCRRFQPVDEIVDRARLGGSFHLQRDAFEQSADELAGLRVAAVLQPRFTWLHPLDVTRIERDRILLERGSVATSRRNLHVHCAAGVRYPPALPIFAADRITLQPVRSGLIPFNAALVGFVEAHRGDDAEKNRLCPTNPFTNTPLDWARATLIQMGADRAWSKEPDLQAWLERSRLNPMRGLRAHADEERVQRALQRFAANVGPGLKRLAAIVGQTAA